MCGASTPFASMTPMTARFAPELLESVPHPVLPPRRKGGRVLRVLKRSCRWFLGHPSNFEAAPVRPSVEGRCASQCPHPLPPQTNIKLNNVKNTCLQPLPTRSFKAPDLTYLRALLASPPSVVCCKRNSLTQGSLVLKEMHGLLS